MVCRGVSLKSPRTLFAAGESEIPPSQFDLCSRLLLIATATLLTPPDPSIPPPPPPSNLFFLFVRFFPFLLFPLPSFERDRFIGGITRSAGSDNGARDNYNNINANVKSRSNRTFARFSRRGRLQRSLYKTTNLRINPVPRAGRR